MEPTKEGYRLSTGTVISVNRGILGITPDDPSRCYEGYDGPVSESEPCEDWMDEAGAAPSLTPDERAEIARYMIALWCQFGDIEPYR